jgi:SAM-dependent methyltransferase
MARRAVWEGTIPAVVPGRRGACLLCGERGGRAVVAERGYVGRACSCGLIYIDPHPARFSVDPTVDGHLESYYSLPARVRLRWAMRFAPGGRFLEVGCGAGALVGEALRRGFTAEAVEPNAVCAERVRRRYGVPVEEARIEESTLPHGRFDLVYHVDLLSHFPGPVEALAAMAHRLAPGGTLCFEVGLFAGLGHGWYRWTGRPNFPAHLWFWSDEAVRDVLDRAGLEVVGTRTFAIAPSTIVSTALRAALPDRARAVPDGAGGAGGAPAPARGSRAQRAYARLHYVLRYRIGAVLPVPGPRTAFFAARRRA